MDIRNLHPDDRAIIVSALSRMAAELPLDAAARPAELAELIEKGE